MLHSLKSLTLTAAPVGGVTIITGYAVLTVLASGEIFTSLTNTLIDACTVAITLACFRERGRGMV